MKLSAEQAKAARADRRRRKREAPRPVPEGVAHVRTNRKDWGLGWWGSVRFGSEIRYVVGTDREDARRQAFGLAHDLGLTAKETP